MTETIEQLLSTAEQARRAHRLDDAKRDLLGAVERGRMAGDRRELARALTALGQIERDLGETEDAVREYAEACGLYRQAGESLRVAHTVRHLADIYRGSQQFGLAEPCYQQALAIYKGDPGTPPLDLANTIRGLALLKEQTGESAEARMLWHEARGLYASVNVEAGVAESVKRLAALG